MANPFLYADVAENATTDLPLLQEVAMDFTTGNILLDVNGEPRIVTENDALKVWIYKALKTERFRHNAYVHGLYYEKANFGVELEQFIGRKPNNEISANEIKRYIYDGLIVNPYITSIEAIDIVVIDHYKVEYQLELTSVYGEVNMIV